MNNHWILNLSNLSILSGFVKLFVLLIDLNQVFYNLFNFLYQTSFKHENAQISLDSFEHFSILCSFFEIDSSLIVDPIRLMHYSIKRTNR